ncbi:hypothetical protein SAMCCGM7_Ch0565 [Sinorhizobium americanum CCGM7]|nr:hypothetical protein SAMCCGM7_Ch0565 [Sinorhizobium americanum CCGM7]
MPTSQGQPRGAAPFLSESAAFIRIVTCRPIRRSLDRKCSCRGARDCLRGSQKRMEKKHFSSHRFCS